MRTNRFREAFKEAGNLAGLAGAFSLSVALLNPIPLFLGAAAEVAYLLFVPDSKWYDSRLSKRFDDEVIARRKAIKDKIVPTLTTEVQQRFFRLEGVRSQITTQSMDEQDWFREVLRKLDYLLEKFLMFAGKEVQFRNYLNSLLLEVGSPAPSRFVTAPSPGNSKRSRRDEPNAWSKPDPPKRRLQEAQYDVGDTKEPVDSCAIAVSVDPDEQAIRDTVEEVQNFYNHERERVEASMKIEKDPDTIAVLEKRVDVLQRRHEYAGKIGKILVNVNHQLMLVEDTFGLINDEIRARSPEQILADIEEVVIATESMTETLEELAPYEQMAARLG